MAIILINIGGYCINGYLWLYVVILLMVMVAILLIIIRGYYINGFSWLFY